MITQWYCISEGMEIQNQCLKCFSTLPVTF